MFCATTDTIQSLTEKTKLLAQKCSQQILSSTPSCVAPNIDSVIVTNSRFYDDVPSSPGDKSTCQSMTILQLASEGNGGQQQHDSSMHAKDNFKEKCLCACKGTIGRFMGKKSPGKERTTKWYIKVKHNDMNAHFTPLTFLNLYHVV